VGQHRNAAADQLFDERGNRRAAFELDRVGPRLLDGAPGVAERLFVAGLVAHERHVEDDERVGCAAPDRFGMMKRLLHGVGERVLVAENGHGQRVAHQQRVDSGGVADGGARGVVDGDHRDFLAGRLAFAEGGDGDFFIRIHGNLLSETVHPNRRAGLLICTGFRIFANFFCTFRIAVVC